MKKILILICIFQSGNAIAQKPLGVYGKQNLIGISFDVNPFGLYRFSKGRLVLPTIQYTRVSSRMRSYTYEFGAFSMRLKDNNSGRDDQKLKVEPYDIGHGYDIAPYHRVTSIGTGKVNGIVFGAYRTAANWVGMGPLGSYHTWGVHVASLRYAKNNNIAYHYINYANQVKDTFYNGSEKATRLVISFSLGFGGKAALRKYERVVWDYGIKCRIPVFGFYKARGYFFDGRKYLVYHGTKSYMASTFLMLYTGLQYAF